MSEHRYPSAALRADYLRSSVGIVLTGGPLLFAHPSSVMVYFLAGLCVLFVFYGARTAVRHGARYEITGSYVRVNGLIGASIDWPGLESVKLRYFSTRRDRSDGWMQLMLRGEGNVIRIDSQISDFEALARETGRQAIVHQAQLDTATKANFDALGFDLDKLSSAVKSTQS